MGIIAGALGRGKASASYTYDFAVLGGAQGAITLTPDAGKLPDNALVVDAYLEPLTDLTSGGAATLSVGHTGDVDAYKVDTAYNDAAFTAANGVSQEAAALPVKLTAASDVTITVSTADLTGGKFRLHVQYIPGS